ncbi:(d)CMP kinase [Haoranjiania flava]|uniref:Cytidylate kinase n=1 Tax=Haoranjiania flava TaxID=1856322 RepID=A0AAE3IPB8_9BACT|nr:(d)CMP kinase [Haoranjiania flava]MCU7695359.1 (d)CMP kinase [Haoranjiania flava]
MKNIIITVDGYSSCGKSTLARALAQELNYIFIDSGAMYRAITLYFLNNQIDIFDDHELEKALRNINLKFQYDPVSGSSHIHLNGVNVENEIRKMNVSNAVSKVAALEKVRDFAVEMQRKMGRSKGIVMDGRDIGTTVFPKAELKVFMTADKNIRVKRRYDELKQKTGYANLNDVIRNIENRDHLDTTRKISPLRQAEDAVVLDNSELNAEEQLAIVLQWAKEKING